MHLPVRGSLLYCLGKQALVSDSLSLNPASTTGKLHVLWQISWSLCNSVSSIEVGVSVIISQ